MPFVFLCAGHVEVVCDKDKISGFSENIKKVEQFLLQLKQNYAKSDFDFVAICLKELYNIIMTVGKMCIEMALLLCSVCVQTTLKIV